MKRLAVVAATAMLAAFACGDDGGSGGTEITFPHAVTLGPEMALVAPTGEIIDHADFLRGDLVTYKNQALKIQSGCPESQAHCQPLHVCKLSEFSKPEEFAGLNEVCADLPAEGENGVITNAETGMGFVVKLNTDEGYGRFWVQEAKGVGDSATVTLVYTVFQASPD
jgi:hypothetical protein